MRLLALGTAVLLAHLAVLWWLQKVPDAHAPQPQPLLVQIRQIKPTPQQTFSPLIQRHPKPTPPVNIDPPSPHMRPVQPMGTAHNQVADSAWSRIGMQPASPPSAFTTDTTVQGVTTNVSPKASTLPLSSSQTSQPNAIPQAVGATTLPSADADYLDNPPPVYPPLSLRRGEQGTVQVRVLISSQGRALRGEVSQSSGFDRLDRAALEAVMKWRYVAAQSNGVAVDKWFTVPVRFRLDEK